MKHFRQKIFFLIVLSMFLLKACKTIEPQKPEETYLSRYENFSRQLSIVNIPVELDLNEVEKEINVRVNNLLYEDETVNEGNNFKIKVWKKDNINVNAAGEQFNVTVPLKIWAEAGINLSNFGFNFAQTRDTEFELDLNFVSNFNVDENWQITSVTSSNGFDWIKKPVLKIGPVNIPLSSFLDEIIDRQQEEIAAQINKEIQPNLDIKKYIQEAWLQMQTPFKISDEFNAWLKISPADVLITPIAGEGKHARMSLGIRGFTETFIGKKPATTLVKEIPMLTIVDSIPDNFIIGLSSEISHQNINSLLKDHLLNKKFQFNDGKQEVVVKDLDVYGHNQNLVLEARLEGDIKGKIYLTGQPYYDDLDQSLKFKNLDFDLDTKNKLVKTASWLAHGKFVETMRQNLKFPLGDQIDQASKTIEKTLNGFQLTKGVYLKGVLQELAPSEVFITPDAVIATVFAKGKSSIRIEELENLYQVK